MTLFHASSRVVLSTTRDGVRTSFDVTSDILTDDENGTFPIEVTKTPSAINGTSVTLYIPKKIINSKGEEKKFVPGAVPRAMIMGDLKIYGASTYSRLDANSRLIEDFLEGRQSVKEWGETVEQQTDYKPFAAVTFEVRWTRKSGHGEARLSYGGGVRERDRRSWIGVQGLSGGGLEFGRP
jgi:hypothetical protein